MLAALLKRGCQVNAPTNDGWTALHEAAANGHALIVDKLLASGAQVHHHTPLLVKRAMRSAGLCTITLYRNRHHVVRLVTRQESG